VRIESRLPSYLVLLRVGFALPAALLRRRCALTAPFHPYPHRWRCGRYIFCGTFRRVVQFLPKKSWSPPGRYPAHCSAEFGLSSPCIRRHRKRPSGPAAYSFILYGINSPAVSVFGDRLSSRTTKDTKSHEGCLMGSFVYLGVLRGQTARTAMVSRL